MGIIDYVDTQRAINENASRDSLSVIAKISARNVFQREFYLLMVLSQTCELFYKIFVRKYR